MVVHNDTKHDATIRTNQQQYETTCKTFLSTSFTVGFVGSEEQVMHTIETKNKSRMIAYFVLNRKATSITTSDIYVKI